MQVNSLPSFSLRATTTRHGRVALGIMIFDCRGREGLIVDPDLGEPAAEVRPFTAMIFAFAVGWLTGSHAGYRAGVEPERVRIDARAMISLLLRRYLR